MTSLLSDTLCYVTPVVVFSCRFAEGFVYYGLSLNSSNLGGNPYVNFAISGAIEIPAYIFAAIICKYCGRIIPFASCLILGGVALLATLPVPEGEVWLVITLSMIGKFFITVTFSIVWTYSAEAYPTSIRNIGLTFTAFFARVSGVLTSYVALLAGVTGALPMLVFGIFAVVAGGLVLLMPETKGQPMPQSIHAGELFIKNNRLFCNRQRDTVRDSADNDTPESAQLQVDV